MTEIQRLLIHTIDELNVQEKRDNRPRFSISFIRNHPGLFVAMYAAFHAIATRISMSSTFACATTGNGTTPALSPGS